MKEDLKTLPDDIIKRIKRNKIVPRYMVMILALFVSSILFNFIIQPANLVTGGVSGISIITKYVYGWSPSLVILVSSATLVIFSFMYLGLEKTSGTIVATIVYPFFVQLTASFVGDFKIDTSDLMLLTIFIGVIGGVCNGLMYKTGFSNGGLPIISQILYKHFKIPISKSSLIMNTTIVFIGGLFFGWTMVMYAIIVIFINSLMIDKVILGVSKNKAFYIITGEEEQVQDYIMNKMKHSVTIFDVKGAFLEKKRKVLLTVIPTREYFHVTEGIKLIDKDAFFVVTDAYQVEGGK